MKAKEQSQLAKLLPKNHPALKSVSVNDLHGEQILAWYGEHGLLPELTAVGASLNAGAAKGFAEFVNNVALYSHAKMESLLATDPVLAGEYALLYMLTAPDEDHLPWVTLSAGAFLRSGLSHYGELMTAFEAIHRTRTDRSSALRYLIMLGNGQE